MLVSCASRSLECCLGTNGCLEDGRKYEIRFDCYTGSAKNIVLQFILCPESRDRIEIPVQNIIWCNPEVNAKKLRRLIIYLKILVITGQGPQSNNYLISFPSPPVHPEKPLPVEGAFESYRDFDNALVCRIQHESSLILSSQLQHYNAVVLQDRYLRKALQIAQLMQLCKMTSYSFEDRELAKQQAQASVKDYQENMDVREKQLLQEKDTSLRQQLQSDYQFFAKKKMLAQQAAEKLFSLLFSDDPVKASMRRACFLETDSQGNISYKPAEVHRHLLGLKANSYSYEEVKKKLFTAKAVHVADS